MKSTDLKFASDHSKDTENSLLALFGDIEDGYIEVGIDDPESKKSYKQLFIPTSKLDSIAKIVGENPDKHIYQGIGIRKSERGGKENVSAIPALFVDIDHITFEEIELDKKLPAHLQPSMVVNSGNGVHLYYFLREPYKLELQDDINCIESINRGLANALNGDKSKTHIASLLRIPGSNNCKNIDNPKLAEIVSLDWNRKFNPSDFEDYIDKGGKTVALTPKVATGLSFQSIIDQCWFFHELQNKAKQAQHLEHFERLYLAFAGIHFRDGEEVLNSIFRSCSDFKEELTRYILRHAKKRNYRAYKCETMKCEHYPCKSLIACRGNNPLDLVKTPNILTPSPEEWRPQKQVELYTAFMTEYKKHRQINAEEEEIMELIIASIFANMLSNFRDPVWIFLVGAPSSGKGSSMDPFVDHPLIISVDEFTPQALFSGYDGENDKDYSMITKLAHKMVFIKEFSTMTKGSKDNVSEIFSVLRSVYDGSYQKMFGNQGESKEYKNVPFGIIAGTVPTIDRSYVTNASLGERFLKVRFPEKKSQDNAISMAIDNALEPDRTRDQLRSLATDVINYCAMPERSQLSFQHVNFRQQLIGLANLIALLRTPVNRTGPQRLLDCKPEREVGTRVAKQLAKLCYGLALLRGRRIVIQEDLNTVAKVVFDDMPRARCQTLMPLVAKESSLTLNQLCEDIPISRTSIQRHLEDAAALGIVGKDGSSYGMSSDVLEKIKRTPLFERFQSQYSAQNS
jgi:hypothetical protein